MSAVVESTILRQRLGRVPYLPTLEAMRAFSAARGADTPDELWLLEHDPVYTRGLAADAAHGPHGDSAIPVVQVERGGEVTYHGPGQLVVYTLIDIARRGIKVKSFVCLLEQALIDLLAGYHMHAQRKPGAPGVYVGGAKVAALGLRVSRGRTIHGLALNVDMDLAPWTAINPCGFPGLAVTQTRALGIADPLDVLGERLADRLVEAIEHA